MRSRPHCMRAVDISLYLLDPCAINSVWWCSFLLPSPDLCLQGEYYRCRQHLFCSCFRHILYRRIAQVATHTEVCLIPMHEIGIIIHEQRLKGQIRLCLRAGTLELYFSDIPEFHYEGGFVEARILAINLKFSTQLSTSNPHPHTHTRTHTNTPCPIPSLPRV